jgi:uncharacterized protein with GYD domain
MPVYVGLAEWTDQGIHTVKDTVTRVGQLQAAVEKAGGRVIGTWWTQGAYDLVTVAEYPDDETASVMAITVAMGGNARLETLHAYTAEDMQRIIQKLP